MRLETLVEELQLLYAECPEGLPEECPERLPEEYLILCDTPNKDWRYDDISEDDLVPKNWRDFDPYYTLED